MNKEIFINSVRFVLPNGCKTWVKAVPTTKGRFKYIPANENEILTILEHLKN